MNLKRTQIVKYLSGDIEPAKEQEARLALNRLIPKEIVFDDLKAGIAAGVVTAIAAAPLATEINIWRYRPADQPFQLACASVPDEESLHFPWMTSQADRDAQGHSSRDEARPRIQVLPDGLRIECAAKDAPFGLVLVCISQAKDEQELGRRLVLMPRMNGVRVGFLEVPQEFPGQSPAELGYDVVPAVDNLEALACFNEKDVRPLLDHPQVKDIPALRDELEQLVTLLNRKQV